MNIRNWSEIQESYPFFWMWLNAWLKKKGSSSVHIINDSKSQYVKVRFNIPYKERELSEEMINDMLDEAGVRVCFDFDSEVTKSFWRYVIFKNNGVKGFWIQTHSTEHMYPCQKAAKTNGYLHAIKEVNDSLKKQNNVEQLWK